MHRPRRRVLRPCEGPKLGAEQAQRPMHCSSHRSNLIGIVATEDLHPGQQFHLTGHGGDCCRIVQLGCSRRASWWSIVLSKRCCRLTAFEALCCIAEEQAERTRTVPCLIPRIFQCPDKPLCSISQFVASYTVDRLKVSVMCVTAT